MSENLPTGQAGKTSRYLKYAIGEIILVVIGILIALQINNWNEERKNKKIAARYVKSLIKDFKSDTLQLKRLIDFHKKNIVGLDSILKLKNKDFSNSSNSASIHLLFLKYGTSVAAFTNTNNTLLQLKNTGNLEIFNERVRDSIIKLEIKRENLLEQGDYYQGIYLNTLEKSKSFLDVTFLVSGNIKNGKYTGKEDISLNVSQQLQKEFFNEIAVFIGSSKLYLESYLKDFNTETKNIIKFLSSEYEREYKGFED